MCDIIPMHQEDSVFMRNTNKYIISQTNLKQITFFFYTLVTNFVPRVAGFLPASLQNVQICRTTAHMFFNSIISASFARTAPEFSGAMTGLSAVCIFCISQIFAPQFFSIMFLVPQTLFRGSEDLWMNE